MGCCQVARSARRSRIEESDAGLTLVELLVVLAILSLFAALAAPQVLRYVGSARSDTAKTQVGHFVSAVELYFLDVGSYPPQELGLKALVDAPPQASGWKGPYIRKANALLDPWGRPYGYRQPGQHGPFDVFSLGRDGQVGGEGDDRDVTSWQ